MRVLLVEDDPMLGDSVKASIAAEGYAIDWLEEGSKVLGALRSDSYDLLVLDNRLPGKTGIDILKAMRAEAMQTPVLLLTACDALSDKVAGLDAGADDYLTKPFDMDELFARMRSLLRRAGNKTPMLKAGDLEMDLSLRIVSMQGEKVDNLTAKEFAILEMLLRNRGRFVTKERLLESCSNWEEEVESNTIEVYISRLRKRFGHQKIETMRGVGYRII